MQLVFYKQLGLGFPRSISMRLLIPDTIMIKLVEILCHVLVQMAFIIFLTDFVILYYEVDFKVPIILGKSFLMIGWALADMKTDQMLFLLNSDKVTFNICQTIRKSKDMHMISKIDIIYEDEFVVLIKERLGVAALAVMLLDTGSDVIDEYDDMVSALIGMSSYTMHQTSWIFIYKIE